MLPFSGKQNTQLNVRDSDGKGRSEEWTSRNIEKYRSACHKCIQFGGKSNNTSREHLYVAVWCVQRVWMRVVREPVVEGSLTSGD